MNSNQDRQEPRLLVAIASFGNHHLDYLRKVIAAYRKLPLKVHVVVLSEAPKNLGDGVEVVVGLPARNPWSLPFAHKPVFARHADQYDLFIYSEDDILFTERNLEAFQSVSPHLAPDEIAGFLLYEMDAAGKQHLCNFHDHFHWKPETVAQRGPHLVAEFSNEHSAFYMLTQAQLRKAIASGGFLRGPYEGRHDMLCAAATDPYTCCGFRKVICISDLEPFLLHHLPNRYLGKVGIPREMVEEQAEALAGIHRGTSPANRLCESETRLLQRGWSKSYYERPDAAVLDAVPRGARQILSVGCGWGALEGALVPRGAEVTAFPLDPVIGAVAARRGVKVVCGTFEECFRTAEPAKFDCIIVSNLLHLQRDPADLLSQCSRLLARGGVIVVKGPNFDRIPILLKRLLGVGDYWRLSDFRQGGVNIRSPKTLARQARTAGLNGLKVQWMNHALPGDRLQGTGIHLGRLTAKDWMLCAERAA